MQKTSWTELKEQKRSQRRRIITISVGMLALVLAFAYMFVWQRVYTLQLAEEHSLRNNRVRLLKERCQALQYEVEFLGSLERIEPIARQDFAMLSLQEARFASSVVPHTPKKQADSVTTPPAQPKPAIDKPKITKKSSVAKKPAASSKNNSKATKNSKKQTTTKSRKTGKSGK